MSNYPPGVTGNEDVFGPKAEYLVDAGDDYECRNCDAPSPDKVERAVWNSGADDSWVCEECGHFNQVDVEPDEPDYDADWGPGEY